MLFRSKADPEEAIHPGEIVGIVKGCVTKKIEGAEQLMVMSSSPIIVGNWKASVPESHVALVAFLGQVPVKVIGPVNQGDYIVAEPTRPGIGRAVSLMDILPEDIDFIVGKAWESSDETAVKLINTVIGFPFGMTIVESRLSQLRSQLKKMSDDNAFLSKKYEGLLLAREEKISILKAKLKQQHVSSLKGASR